MSETKYYLTTPVYDLAAPAENGPLYTAILGDTIARHKRMCGFDVAHLGAADSHGMKVEDFSERSGEALATVVEQNWRKLEEFSRLAEIGCTHFSWIWSAEHIRAAQTLLRRIMRYSQTAIHKGKYEGRYCIYDNIDVSDSLEPADCPLCKRPAAPISEDRYFFRPSAFQDRLAALYKYHPEFIHPQIFSQEIESAMQGGLKNVPISRKSSERGVPWPDDPDQIVSGSYAALAVYLSGIGFGRDEMQPSCEWYGTEHRLENQEFKRYWPPNLHVIGREALRLHAIYWPALLMAGDLPVPRHILAHGMLSSEQQATKDAPSPDALLQALGGEGLRYCLLREVRYGEDAHLNLPGLVARYNEDLVNGLAKLVDQILTLVARYCDSRIPVPSLSSSIHSVLEIALFDLRAEVRFLFDNFNFSEGLAKIWSMVAMIRKTLEENVILDSMENSDGKTRITNALHDACQCLGWIAMLLHPVLPETTNAIWKSLGQTTSLEDPLIDTTPLIFLMPGNPIGQFQLQALFLRAE